MIGVRRDAANRRSQTLKPGKFENVSLVNFSMWTLIIKNFAKMKIMDYSFLKNKFKLGNTSIWELEWMGSEKSHVTIELAMFGYIANADVSLTIGRWSIFGDWHASEAGLARRKMAAAGWKQNGNNKRWRGREKGNLVGLLVGTIFPQLFSGGRWKWREKVK